MKDDQWYESRRKAIGASDVAAIMGINPYVKPWDVWADKTGRLEPFGGNEATSLGENLEPILLDAAEDDLGPLNRDVVFQNGILRATCDGVLKEGNIPVECKTAGLTGPLSEEWGPVSQSAFPQHYYLQIQTQMICTGAGTAYLYALLGGQGIKVYEVLESSEMQAYIQEFCEAWWEDHVMGDREPVQQDPPPAREILSRMIREEGSSCQLPGDDVVHALNRLDQLKHQRKFTSDCIRTLEDDLIRMLGDCEIGIADDGRQITYKSVNRRGYTVAPSTHRRFSVVKSKG